MSGGARGSPIHLRPLAGALFFAGEKSAARSKIALLYNRKCNFSLHARRDAENTVSLDGDETLTKGPPKRNGDETSEQRVG